MRLLYNAILGVVTGVTVFSISLRITRNGSVDLAFALAAWCFVVNVCYCVGPILNGYASYWFGLRSGTVTILIFSMGILNAVLSTYLVVAIMGSGKL